MFLQFQSLCTYEGIEPRRNTKFSEYTEIAYSCILSYYVNILWIFYLQFKSSSYCMVLRCLSVHEVKILKANFIILYYRSFAIKKLS